MNLSIKGNGNYAAKVFKLSALHPIPKADKIARAIIDGNNVITGVTAQIGALYIYFPLECAINSQYLSYSNSFAHAELNADKSKKGFFGDQGRVRAVKLRGERSEGYIVPVSDLVTWLNSAGKPIDAAEFTEGKEFDHVDEIKICEKYVNRAALRQMAIAARKDTKHVKRTSKLIDLQFRFHIDTEHLKKNIGKINPEDNITISYKLHGASAIVSKILCKKPLKWYEKLAKACGLNIVDTHYDYVWASRRVIKNQYADDDTSKQHFYDSDIWKLAAERVKESILDGITLYMELVGQTPTGAWIQKEYDYGTAPAQMDCHVYRITYTNPSGKVFEFSSAQVQRYCIKMGLKCVPIFYQGKAKDLFPELATDGHWHVSFLKKMLDKYTEKDCYICKNKVPEEGVVLVVESDEFQAYKLKSFRFLEKETAELDSGAVDLETVESVAQTPNETTS